MKPYIVKTLLVLVIVGALFLGIKFIFNSRTIPGETLCDSVLIKDAMVDVVSPFVLVINEKTNCNLSNITPGDIVNSKIVQQPNFFTSDGKTYGTWTEDWTIRACEKLVHIPIKFIQIEGVPGTSYTSSSSDIVIEDL